MITRKARTGWFAAVALTGLLTVGPPSARACFDVYGHPYWCYEPFVCNYFESTSEMVSGSLYANADFTFYRCSQCPSIEYLYESGSGSCRD